MCTASVQVGSSVLVDDTAFASWEEAVHKAAQSVVSALSQQAGTGGTLTLQNVPLDTLQVYTGRQHHIGLSIDGVEYQVVLGSDKELSKAYGADGAAAAAGALPPTAQEDTAVTSGLVRQHWQLQGSSPAEELALPDVTLAGPLELRLTAPAPLRFFIPHPADATQGALAVRLGPGVTVRVSGLKSIQLRRPLDLPNLPLGYLQEVYAHVKLGTPATGFDQAAGVQFLASRLQALALNASLPLLTFDVTPAAPATGLAFTSAEELPGSRGPRLKLRTRGGLAELSLRAGQVLAVDKAEEVVRRAVARARPWAWPVPHVDMGSLVPYEALLRSIIAAHPFDLRKVERGGISLKVTKSEIRGTRLMAFEMEVRSALLEGDAPDGQAPLPDRAAWEALLGPETLEAAGVGPGASEKVLVFDVVVSVQEKPGVAEPGAKNRGQPGRDWVYVPISVRLREVHGSTLAISRSDFEARLAGVGNGTVRPPLGYDHEDLGLARQAAH